MVCNKASSDPSLYHWPPHVYTLALRSLLPWSAALFLGLGSVRAQDDTDLMTDLRTHMRDAFKDEDLCDRLQERLRKEDLQRPVLKGYMATLTMAKSVHLVNPFAKFAPFNEGKAMLEEAIATEPASVELRFLRLTIQANVPGFMDYDEALAEDRAFIEAHLGEVPNITFRNRIIDFIARADAEGKL